MTDERVEPTSEWMAARALILSTSEWWDGMTDAARRGAVDNAAAILASQPERVECDEENHRYFREDNGYKFCPDCGQSLKGEQ